MEKQKADAAPAAEDDFVHVFSEDQEAYIQAMIDKAIIELERRGPLLPRIAGR